MQHSKVNELFPQKNKRESVESNIITDSQPIIPEIIECEDNEECFNEALLSCSKAKFFKENSNLNAAKIRITTIIEHEITKFNDDEFCVVIQTSTNQAAGYVIKSECLYEGTHQVQCRTISDTG